MGLLTTRIPWEQAQTLWSATLNPIIKNPLSSANILPSINLATGDNVINHLLGRPMQGWFFSDINAPIVYYRSAPLNDLTLTINSSGAATVNIVVF